MRYHRVTWFCAMHPRRLVALPLPPGSGYVGTVVARGRFLAYSYYQDVDCEYAAPAARSIDRNTGEVLLQLPPQSDCIDVASTTISDLALSGVTGAFAVIRNTVDYEDDLGDSTVLAVGPHGRRTLAYEPKRNSEDNLSRTRIFPHSLWFDGRLHWRRADGPRRATL